MADTATTDGLTTWKNTSGTNSKVTGFRNSITFGAYSNVILGVHCKCIVGFDTQLRIAFKQSFPLDYDTSNIFGKGVCGDYAHNRIQRFGAYYRNKIEELYQGVNQTSICSFKNVGSITEEVLKSANVSGMQRKIVKNAYQINSGGIKLKANYGAKLSSKTITSSAKLTKLDSNKTNANVGKALMEYSRTGNDKGTHGKLLSHILGKVPDAKWL